MSGSHEQLTGSASVTDVRQSTAKNKALLRQRSSPLRISWSRRLAGAEPPQTVRCVHAGEERAISSGGPRPPLLSHTRQHDVRATMPPSGSDAAQKREKRKEKREKEKRQKTNDRQTTNDKRQSTIDNRQSTIDKF